MNEIQYEELSRCLFDESSDANFVFDTDENRILDTNPTAQRLTGMSKKQLLGKTITDILIAEDSRSIEELIHAYQSTGVFHSKEGYRLQSSRNESLLVSLRVSRIHTTPKPLGLAVARDITSRRRSEKVLRLIVEGTSLSLGENYFSSLVRHLAIALEVRCAFVSELHEQREGRLRLLAFWSGNDFEEIFEYDSEGTPCELVIKKGLVCYPENVQQFFPKDQWLIDFHLESY